MHLPYPTLDQPNGYIIPVFHINFLLITDYRDDGDKVEKLCVTE